MARIKPAAFVVRNLEQVDETLHRIGEIDHQLEQEQRDLTQRIEDFKKQLLDEQAPLVAERERLAQAVESYATHEKDELFPDGEKRSIDLPFGIIGWRRSTEVTLSRKCTPAHLKTLGLTGCVITKETVSKAELAKLDEATLVKTGAKQKEKDTFYLELNRSRLEQAFQAAQNRMAS